MNDPREHITEVLERESDARQEYEDWQLEMDEAEWEFAEMQEEQEEVDEAEQIFEEFCLRFYPKK